MTMKQTRFAALAVALAFSGGVATFSIASAQNTGHPPAPIAAAQAPHSAADNDVETADDGPSVKAGTSEKETADTEDVETNDDE